MSSWRKLWPLIVGMVVIIGVVIAFLVFSNSTNTPAANLPAATATLKITPTPTIQPTPATPMPTADTPLADLQNEIDTKEKAWEALTIKNYRIELVGSTGYFNGTQKLEIIVRDSQIADWKRICAPMGGFKDCGNKLLYAVDSVVPGLFKEARKIAPLSIHPDYQYVDIQFNAKYNFPRMLKYNQAHFTDMDFTLEVTMFEVIP